MTSRIAIFAALMMTLAACQSTSGLNSADDCSQINNNNRERCLSGQ